MSQRQSRSLESRISSSLATLAGVLLLGLASASDARGDEWRFPGARYQGMGGAGVAVVDDAHATYWNPGALAFDASTSIELPFSFSLQTEGGAIAVADDIAQLIDEGGLLGTLSSALTAIDDPALALSDLQLQDALQLASRLPGLGEGGEGVVALPEAELKLRRGRMAINVRGTGTLGLNPVVDLGSFSFSNDWDVADVVPGAVDRSSLLTLSGQSLADDIALEFGPWSQNQAEELVYQAEQTGLNTSSGSIQSLLTGIAGDTAGGLAASLTQNGSGVWIDGLFTEEVGIAYGQPLFGNRLGVGGGVRYIRGITTSQFIRYDSVDSGQALLEDLLDIESRVTSERVSADVGVLYRPNYRWRFGVVARNINSPKFDSNGPDDFELKPQVRAGVAVKLLKGWLMAVDLDLTENDSEVVDGLASRFLSLGTEFQFGIDEVNFALRAGAFTNLAGANPMSAPTLTAGVGFGLLGLQFDLAVAAAANLEEIEAGGLELPSRLNFSGAIKWESQF